jgi:hypothetical protein
MQVSATDWPVKLVLSQETGSIELFDLESDPQETRNLADQRKDKIPPLLARIRAWQAHSRNLIEDYAAILKNNGHKCDAPATAPQAPNSRP